MLPGPLAPPCTVRIRPPFCPYEILLGRKKDGHHLGKAQGRISVSEGNPALLLRMDPDLERGAKGMLLGEPQHKDPLGTSTQAHPHMI